MTLAFMMSVWVDGPVGVSGDLLMEVAGEQRTRGGHHPGSLDESTTDQQQPLTEGCPRSSDRDCSSNTRHPNQCSTTFS